MFIGLPFGQVDRLDRTFLYSLLGDGGRAQVVIGCAADAPAAADSAADFGHRGLFRDTSNLVRPVRAGE